MIPFRLGDWALRSPSIRARELSVPALGGLLGGLVGGAFVVGFTLTLKAMMDFLATQATWVLITVPLVGLALAISLLHGFGRGESERRAGPWRTFPRGAVRADITSDVVEAAGREERFPWRLA